MVEKRPPSPLSLDRLHARQPQNEPQEDAPLLRARDLIEQAIRRRWSQGLLTRDPEGALAGYLNAEDVERLFQDATRQPARGPVTAPIQDFAYPPHSPLGLLVEQLRLSPSQADLLAVLLAGELDPAAARLGAYLSGNQTQFHINLDLLFEIVYRARGVGGMQSSALMRRDLAAADPLRRFRCLVLDGSESRSSLAQTIRMHPRLVDWLVDPTSRGDLAASDHLYPPEEPRGECQAEDLHTAAAALGTGNRLLLIDGMPRSGRLLLARFAAARLGRPLLVINARGMNADRLVASFREALLQRALLAFSDAEEVLEGEIGHTIRDCLAAFPDAVVLIGSEQLAHKISDLRPVTIVSIKVPGFALRMALWRRYLGEEHDLKESELQRIAGLYNLGISGIVDSTAIAHELASFAGRPVRAQDVAIAVRQLFDRDLSSVATRTEVSQTWDDLVLSEELAESVFSIIERVRLRPTVYGEWGFARKLGKGLGMTALFSGEPGTGKSAVAGLIARELGLDCYVVDLSRLTSKWLGETEKNLARAFDAAEAGHVLLLFDEADSVLSRRSAEVRSANDRNANLETNYILARIEQFQGIAVFTTNLASAIDPAVARRMMTHIHFPFPDIECRAEIWHRMLPAEVPLLQDIDFHLLAERFELSGGFIRNIVVRAAYLAAGEGHGLGMEDLVRSAEMEYRERGMLLSGGRLV